MTVRRTLAGFVGMLVLSISLSSVACDTSCAVSLPQAENMAQWAIQATGLADCQHGTTSPEQPTIRAFSLCDHHSCGDPANLYIQKASPASLQLRVAILVVAARLQRQDFPGIPRRSPVEHPTNLLADIPSTSLRL